ncbi:MAG TPA: ABC transporter substrate-binding protein [Levilinea sp.]|nr:ABC transporter substrate-binding protein [Levilinea sp.]
MKKFGLLVSLLVLASLVLGACAPQVVEREVVVTEVVEQVVEREVPVEVEVVVEVTPVPEVVDRTSAWLDTIVVVEEPSADAAVSRLEVGDIDVYASTVGNREVAARVAANPALRYTRSFGSYNEISLNPTGPVWEATGKLNPFAVPAMREAFNWLVDRNYIAQEIMGGMAIPRWTPFNNASNDYAAMADVIKALEFEYSYDLERARAVFDEEMPKLGAEMVNGVWNFEGEPVVLSVLTRTEDERRFIGDYVATQLETIGFTAFRDYKTAAEASPLWISGDPAAGLWHVYTGGWITTAVPRDLGDNFEFFYTNRGLPSPLWLAYTPTEEFDTLALRLSNRDYTTLEERRELVTRALELSFEDSVRVWLVDRSAITPMRAEVSVAADLYGAVSGSQLWPYTLRRTGEVGGSMRIALPSVLTNPWNPLNGSNWIFDMMLLRGIGEYALNADPFTGLFLPQRIERAELVVQEGLPVGATHDWVTVTFADEIVVPEDAWADWDAEAQTFLTVGEVHPDGLTALRKSTVFYPADLYDTVTWHDGSPFSAADVVMAMIMQFDRANEASANFDAAVKPAHDGFMASFKAMRIASVDPLVVEHWSDLWEIDAEQMVNAWWPFYLQGQGSWHMLTVGLMAEARGEVAFSEGKATANEVEWLSYIAGPTLEFLRTSLAQATEENTIPYTATLGEFITAEEATQRWANYNEFVRRRGHFLLGTGVFSLERAFPIEGNVILQRNPNHPDNATKWDRWAAPAIAEVEVDGPARVTIGEEATFEVFVSFAGNPYAVADVREVKFLLFDATGVLAQVGVATAIEDGLWEVALTDTSGLAVGSNRLEVVVVSNLVAVPSSAVIEFVTAE